MSVATHDTRFLSIFRGERNLGPLEHAYRQQSLKADLNQIIRLGWILIVGLILYASIEHSPLGSSTHLTILDIARGLIIVYSLISMFILRRTTSYHLADWLVLIWSVAVVGFLFYVHSVFLPALLYSILGDLLIILAFYTIFPNRFYFRLVPALLISAGDLVLLWFARDQLSLIALRFIAATLLLGNLLGLINSAYLYTYRRNQFLAQHEEQLARQENERLATLDSLTQVFNRRRFMELATNEFQRFQRYQRPFSLLAMDLDYFKHINDTFGHSAGDAVLQEFATLARSLIRQSDCLGRLGGEEFTLLLPETPAAYALQLADRVREQCEQLTLPSPRQSIKITVSIGVTEVHPKDVSLEDTLNRADQALYFVKEHSRNATHLLKK